MYKKGKLIDFKRNITFESVNVRNNKSMIAFNYAGLIIINKLRLLKHSKIFKKSDNFEKSFFYPVLIKRYKTKIVSIKGLFHSIDNMKDVQSGNYNSSEKTYRDIKQIKKRLLKR